MKSVVWPAVLLCGLGLWVFASESRALELTGLVDLAATRAALLETGSGGRSLLLHVGETSDGITLKDLDVRSGWALIAQGTNEIKLRLASYCAASTAPVVPDRLPWAVAQRSATAAGVPGNPLVGQAAEAAGPAPGSQAAAPRYAPPPPGLNSPWLENYLAGKLSSDAVAPAAQTQPQLGLAQAQSSAAVTTPAVQEQPQPEVPRPSQADGTALAGSAAASSSDHPAAAGLPQIAADPLKQEGDLIRTLYGFQAYLAWDLARSN